MLVCSFCICNHFALANILYVSFVARIHSILSWLFHGERLPLQRSVFVLNVSFDIFSMN